MYNLQGAALAGNNQHDQAIEFYKKAIDLEPQNEEIYRNLSKSLIAIKKFDEAIKYLKTLNNQSHIVYSAISVLVKSLEVKKNIIDKTIVTFNKISKYKF